MVLKYLHYYIDLEESFMNSALKRLLFEVGLLFLLIFLVSRVNPLYGTLLLIAYFAYKLFALRYSLFSMIGKTKFDRGDKDGALIWYGKAARVSTCRPRTIISYAYLLLIEERIKEAEEALHLVKNDALDPREKINYFTTKALIEWKSDNLEGAIKTLEDANLELKALMIYESLGYLLLLSKDYERALKFNLEAFEYDNNDEIIIDNLAESYYFLGQYDKSKEIYENLTKRNLTFSEPYYYLASIYIKEEKIDQARDLLDLALKCPQGFLTAIHKEDIECLLRSIDEQLISSTEN